MGVYESTIIANTMRAVFKWLVITGMVTQMSSGDRSAVVRDEATAAVWT